MESNDSSRNWPLWSAPGLLWLAVLACSSSNTTAGGVLDTAAADIGASDLSVVGADTSGSAAGDTTDPFSAAGGHYYYKVTSGSAEYTCVATPEAGTKNVYLCQKNGTTDWYDCKVSDEGDGTKIYICAPVPPTPPVDAPPPCSDFHQMGDGKSGLSCWAPPENYCRYAGGGVGWVCKADGSKCCPGGSECFPCGWVTISVNLAGTEHTCKVGGDSAEQTEAFCAAFYATIPAKYQKCIENGCFEAERQAYWADPDCVAYRPDPNLLICP